MVLDLCAHRDDTVFLRGGKEKFNELVKKQFPNGLKIDGSPELISALNAAADGDFSVFDEIESKLRENDNLNITA